MKLHASLRTRTIFFCFADPVGFSGQKAATRLLVDGLGRRGWICRCLRQPVLERASDGLLARLRYAIDLAQAWGRSVELAFVGEAWIAVNLGQTWVGLLRDAVPLLVGRQLFGRERVVVSLHGSVFMRWPENSPLNRTFGWLVRQAGMVTVLGETQRARLNRNGIGDTDVEILVNSCDLVPKARIEAPANSERAVRCLFLSSLIDTKGYPEYLEALELLAGEVGTPIEAVLCGRVTPSEFARRFHSASEAEGWINAKIEQLNRSSRVKALWVHGAAGAEKAKLFHAADIFVLPTSYAVEAQPLVLLEAMAAGCAIVCSRIGEIPTILDEETAVLLSDVSKEAVARALRDLANNAERRALLGRKAYHRYVGCYDRERHLDRWEKLLQQSISEPHAIV